MHVLIAGAGAVGGYYGSLLWKGGVKVSYLVTPRSLSIIQEKGLTVKSQGGVYTFHPEVSVNPVDLTPFDLIIIAVKRYDTGNVLNSLRPVIKKGTLILSLQNGIDSEEEILERFPEAEVLGGVAFLAARLDAPGIVEHMGAGSISIGELNGSESERVDRLVKVFKGAGVPVRSSHDIYKSKWQKLCWNAIFNPLSVILKGPIDYVLDSKDAIEIAFKIFGEIRSLAEKKGVILSEDLLDEHIAVTQKLRGFHTSMYEDLIQGKPTEIDYFNGYVCREGAKYHVGTPVNCMITSLVKAILSRPSRSS